MFERLRDNFMAGIGKLRWYATLFAERVKIEIAVVKLINELKSLEGKKDSAVRAVGERVFELRNQEGYDILNDSRVRDSVKEIERLDKEIDELRGKIGEMAKPEEPTPGSGS